MTTLQTAVEVYSDHILKHGSVRAAATAWRARAFAKTRRRQYETALTNVATAIAAYVLDQHENPSGRADGLVFDPQRSDALMLAALTSDLGTRITVTETVTGLSSDFFIHRMDFRIMAGRYMEVTLGLSASAFASDFWILEDADSELGVNTYLGYG